MKLTFLGATGTVTGSRYLLEEDGCRILVDCGLFQGLKSLRLRNWTPLPIAPSSIEAVVLTHAHLDHSGYIPVLVREGFRGPVLATPATCDLCGILLPDSGHLLEEEAGFANRHGTSKHKPALPLYTSDEAERSLDSFVAVRLGEERRVGPFTFHFVRAGHIPGAASVVVEAGGVRVGFSGDVGRPNDALLYAPEPLPRVDYLVVESTYGDREHPDGDPQAALGEVVRKAIERGGVVVIPAFAVGRAQTILYHLHALRVAGKIPSVPIYIDSPMAADATRIFQKHVSDHRLSQAECSAVCSSAIFTRSVKDSKEIAHRNGPMIVISASGMATGGRVLFHLERFAPDHRNAVLLVGHQAAGTRGDQLAQGQRRLKIHGKWVEVRAEVVTLNGLSAHADAREILQWLEGFEAAPKMTFVTHGEPRGADAMRFRIADELGWAARVPEAGEVVELSGSPQSASVARADTSSGTMTGGR
jgi:metallo-beta-lactamase family protein